MMGHPVLLGHWWKAAEGWMMIAAKPPDSRVRRGSRVNVATQTRTGEVMVSGKVVSRPFHRPPDGTYRRGRYDHLRHWVTRGEFVEWYPGLDVNDAGWQSWDEPVLKMLMILPDRRNPAWLNPYDHPDYVAMSDRLKTEADAGRPYSCVLRLPGCEWRATTPDHIRPLSRGGGPGWRNLQPSCEKCNLRKGNRIVKEKI